MERLRRNLQKISDLSLEIIQLKGDCLEPIDKVAPHTFELKTHFGGIGLYEIHSGQGHDLHHKCWFGDAEIRTFVEVIEHVMREQDFPVPQRDLQDLFNTYDLNNEERDLLLKAASSDEAYDNWVDEERRMLAD